ncbi:MAG: hypothetical protein L0J58_04710, partial [Micrococcaceae bacterium]|nr:hypothetical protein [Micrococcaceae bacterium]
VTNSPPPAGPGSAADAGEPGTGTGVRRLRLRVEQLGGELTAAVHDGGWQVSVRLPVRASEEDLEHSGAGLAGRASVPPAEGPA